MFFSSKKGIINQILSLNWLLVGLVTVVSLIGFAVLYSAAEASFEPWALKQIIRFLVLLPLAIAIALIDLKVLLKYSYFIYGVVIVLLLMITLNVFSVTAMGATRWIKFGPVTLQPSELMKICLVFALAKFFHQASIVNIHRIIHLIIPGLLILVPVAMIIEQPDLGTALILLMVGTSVLFAAGVRIWKFLVAGGFGAAIIPIAWHFMHDYQKKRVNIFLDPDSDPLGAGYNIMQSKIAIGSGGFLGKGFLHGSQSQLSFLPEKQTDFIFTMFSEEFGFIGGLVLILLYLIIFIFGLVIAIRSNNHFGRLLAFGMVSIFSFHVFVNIGMVMGILPVVGAPLPLLSYGGTIMATMMVILGILLNIDLHSNEELN